MSATQHAAESATGCRQRGSLSLLAGTINRKGQVSTPGHDLTPPEAYDWMREHGGEVDVPNAGAGSARAVFESMGLSVVETLDHTSSAGDWAFLIRDGAGGMLYPAWQSNRYPRAGFSYSIDFNQPFDTVEQVIACLFP